MLCPRVHILPEIEVSDNEQTLKFYDACTGAIIETHQIAQGIGKYVSRRNAERYRDTRYDELKDKVLAGFENDSEAASYIEAIIQKMPRYARAQLRIFAKMQENHSLDELKNAVRYCVSRALYSATDFRNTLAYLKITPDAPQSIKNVDIPLKYRVVTAQTRSLEVYGNMCMGGTDCESY